MTLIIDTFQQWQQTVSRYEEALKSHVYLLENDRIHELNEALLLTATIMRRTFEEAKRLNASVKKNQTTTYKNWLLQAQRLETLSKSELQLAHSVTDDFSVNHSLTLRNVELCNIVLHCDALNCWKSPTGNLGFYINSDHKNNSFYFVKWEQYINLLMQYKATDPLIINDENWNLMNYQSTQAIAPKNLNEKPQNNVKHKEEKVQKLLSVCGPKFLDMLENPHFPHRALPNEIKVILDASSTDELQKIISISRDEIYDFSFEDLHYLESIFNKKLLNDEIVAFEALYLSSLLLSEFPTLRVIINRYLSHFEEISLSSLYTEKLGPSIFVVLKALELGIWNINKSYQTNPYSLTKLRIIESVGSEIDTLHNQELDYEFFKHTKEKIWDALPTGVEPPFAELAKNSREVAKWRSSLLPQSIHKKIKPEWSSDNRIMGTLRIKGSEQ
jgi:hypothetical protein